MRGHRPTLVVVAVLAVALIAAGSVAWAQVGSTGVISGCLNRSGFIRGVDETTGTCREGETAVSWYSKEGADAAFLSKSGKAADSDLLDGLDSAAFAPSAHDHDSRYYTQAQSDAQYLPRTGTAADADRLDGMDAFDFTQGAGSVSAGFSVMAQGDATERHLIGDFGALDLVCRSTAGGEPDARFVLHSFEGPYEHFFDKRTDGGISVPADPTSTSFGGLLGLTPGTYLIQATRAGGPTVTVTGTVWYDGGCNVQFLAVVGS